MDYNTLKMIKRSLLDRIKSRIDYKKVILILGARQVGKTSLIKTVAEESGSPYMYFNADEPLVREMWKPEKVEELLVSFGGKKMIILDEAQLVENAGLTLKILIDRQLGIQFLVTGSSALELANKTFESLTGRKWTMELYPISTSEYIDDSHLLEANRQMPNRLIYGSYPEVISNISSAREILSNIMQSYLFKDIFAIAGIRKPAMLEKLVRAIALQIGQEVSLNELSRLIGLDVKTIDQYIHILQQAYIVFSLPAFSRNVRNEISRGRKIYFWDNGIRNALLNNFTAVDNRADIGFLWENFLVTERLKENAYRQRWVNSFFWRTTAQQEIDYLEEANGRLYAYEFKWNAGAKVRFPKTFKDAYQPVESLIIHRENYWKWLQQENL